MASEPPPIEPTDPSPAAADELVEAAAAVDDDSSTTSSRAPAGELASPGPSPAASSIASSDDEQDEPVSLPPAADNDIESDSDDEEAVAVDAANDLVLEAVPGEGDRAEVSKALEDVVRSPKTATAPLPQAQQPLDDEKAQGKHNDQDDAEDSDEEEEEEEEEEPCVPRPLVDRRALPVQDDFSPCILIAVLMTNDGRAIAHRVLKYAKLTPILATLLFKDSASAITASSQIIVRPVALCPVSTCSLTDFYPDAIQRRRSAPMPAWSTSSATRASS
jgi:hypothetical protein